MRVNDWVFTIVRFIARSIRKYWLDGLAFFSPRLFFIAVINVFLFFDPVCFFLVFVLHYGRASPAQEFRQRNAYLIVVPRCQEGKRNYYGTLVCGQRAVVGFFIHMRFSIFLFLPRPWPLTWCRPTKYSWFLPKFRSTNIAKQAGAIPLYIFFFPLDFTIY